MSHYAIENIFYKLKFVSNGKIVAKTGPWFACFCVMIVQSWFLLQWSNAAAHFVMLVVCLIRLLLTKLNESVTTIDVTFSQTLRVVVMSNYGRLASVEDASLFWSCRKCLWRLPHIWNKMTRPNMDANYMSMQIVVWLNTEGSREFEMSIWWWLFFCRIPTGHSHEKQKYYGISKQCYFSMIGILL